MDRRCQKGSVSYVLSAACKKRDTRPQGRHWAWVIEAQGRVLMSLTHGLQAVAVLSTSTSAFQSFDRGRLPSLAIATLPTCANYAATTQTRLGLKPDQVSH